MNWDDMKFFLEVARSQRLSEASKRLNVDPSTVSRRLYKLEDQMNTQFFSRTIDGHVLTEYGNVLFDSALQMEKQMQYVTEVLQGKNQVESGRVKVGTTEAFGTFFVMPKIAEFVNLHPNISIDILPLPRFIKHEKLEADISISLEKPKNSALIGMKLCDYRLKLYGSKQYLAEKSPIATLDDIQNHSVIGYVKDLTFSAQLQYLDELFPGVSPNIGSTSVIAQYMAVNAHLGLAILPCFLAKQNPDLVPILEDQLDVIRTFWLVAHPEQRKLARIKLVWDFLKVITEEHKCLMMDD